MSKRDSAEDDSDVSLMDTEGIPPKKWAFSVPVPWREPLLAVQDACNARLPTVIRSLALLTVNHVLHELDLKPVPLFCDAYPHLKIANPKTGEPLRGDQCLDLGQGGFASVTLRRYEQPDGSQLSFIIKQTLRKGHRETLYKSFLAEVVVRRYLEKHAGSQFVIDPLCAIYETDGEEYGMVLKAHDRLKRCLSLQNIVTPGASADRHVPKNAKPCHLVDYFGMAARQLEILHKSGVAHRDIDMSNIVVDFTLEGDSWTKLVDFGAAQFLPNSKISDLLRLKLPVAALLCDRACWKLNKKLPFVGKLTRSAPIAGHVRSMDPSCIYYDPSCVLQPIYLESVDIYAFAAVMTSLRGLFSEAMLDAAHQYLTKFKSDPSDLCKQLVERLQDEDTDRKKFYVHRSADADSKSFPAMWSLVERCQDPDVSKRPNAAGVALYFARNYAALHMEFSSLTRRQRKTSSKPD